MPFPLYPALREKAAEFWEKPLIVVSGLARGIDASAQHADLDMGTITVLAGEV